MTNGAVAFARCPGCGTAVQDARMLFAMHDAPLPLRVLQCGGCGLVFKERHPDGGAMGAVYGDDYVHFSGSFEVSAADVNSAREKLRRSVRLLADPGGRRSEIRVLDIGCGDGQFVRIARSLGYAAEGIDPYLPQRLVGAGLRRATPAELAPGSYDVAMLLNVAEHVTEPAALFASVRRLLRAGGVALITCPDGACWARRAYEGRWCHMALSEHLLFWTRGSLEHCLRRAGFAGRARCRSAGSPFPYGVAPAPSGAASGSAGDPPSAAVPSLPQRVQRAAWRMARRIQSAETLGNAVRWAVNAARLGDYLEFAIGRDATPRTGA